VIPALYKNIVMELTTPLSFCLPSEKDEGICPLTLTRFLGERHNHFVERVDEILLLRGKDTQRSIARHAQPVISSKFFSAAHALHYELIAAGGFVPFVEKQCVQYSTAGGVLYDFKNAELYLLDIFSGKPVIQLEVRMFQYSNTEGAGSYNLKQKVEQVALHKDQGQNILKELGSISKARACLELLETCISFLQATGGTLDVAELTLGDYVKNVLLLETAEFGSAIIAQHVQLKHIDSLWRLLRDFAVADPFANVHPKYRVAFKDQKDQEAVAQAAESMDKTVLLPIMKEYLISQLKEAHTNAAATIKSTIGIFDHNDQDLADVDWFKSHFPEHILMANMLVTYQAIESSRS